MTTAVAHPEAALVEHFLGSMEDGTRFVGPNGVVYRVLLESPPVKHSFAPGVYMREIFNPAGMVVVGAEIVEPHHCVLYGRARVWMNGEWTLLEGYPKTFVSQPAKRIVCAETDLVWITTHHNPDNCQDIAELERRYTRIPPQQIREDYALRRKAAQIDQFRHERAIA